MPTSTHSSAIKTALMPSPIGISEPRNEAEVQIKQMIDEALSSGHPAQFDDAATFMRQAREQSQIRQTQRRSR